MSVTAFWTILSSSAAMPSVRFPRLAWVSLPAGRVVLGMPLYECVCTSLSVVPSTHPKHTLPMSRHLHSPQRLA